MALLQTGIAKSTAEDYTIDQSLRVDDGDTAYLSKTFGDTSFSDKKKFTFSCWVKLGNLGANTASTYRCLMSNNKTSGGAVGIMSLEINGDDKLYGYFHTADGSSDFVSTEVLRDPSAWYHIHFIFDSANATASERGIFYLNGELAGGSWDLDIKQNFEPEYTADPSFFVGREGWGTGYFDGYLAEVYFIDGQALTPASFCETDSTTNQWKPKEYDGSYGTNGFYQKYAATELANSFFDSGYGGRHTITAQGDAHTDTSVKKIGTASLQCDGTGDYLLGPTNNSDFVFGTGDFTIESWIRMDDVTSANGQGIGAYADSSGYNGFTFRIRTNEATDRLDFSIWDASSLVVEILSTTLTWVNDTWYHVAVVRSGNNFNLYRDGVSVATTVTNSGSMTASSSSKLQLAADYSGGSGGRLEGYLDELRISDTARYVDDFTPSTTAFTNDANTLLLLHMDGADDGTSFPDSASHAITANGDVANSRAQSKIGDSSIYFEDGSDDYLTIPTGYDFGTGDFTIEMWVKVTTPVNGGNIICSDTVDQGYLGASNSTTPWTTYFAAGGADPEGPSIDLWGDGAWHHVAVVRKTANSGEEISLYIDGTEGTKVEDTASHDYTGYIFGHNYATSGYEFNGYMDEIRVSSVARYDGDFTPSTTEFTADANTKLLIHSNWDGGLGADSSGNYNTFTATNLVATDQMEDSPSNNFATLNPLVKTAGTVVFSEGNLEADFDGSQSAAVSTINVSSGKWYVEYRVGDGSNDYVGIIPDNAEKVFTNAADPQTGDSLLYAADGRERIDGTFSSYGTSMSAGDIVGIALNMTDSEITFYLNNVSQGAISFSGSVSTASSVLPCTMMAVGMPIFNFGQDSSFAGNETAQGNQDSNSIGDFYYEPPSGYLALCTSNLSAPEIADPTEHFNTTIWTGDTSTYPTSRSLTGVGFKPDFVWAKVRSTTGNSSLYDAVRGAEEYLASSESDAELNQPGSGYLTSFDSDGSSWADGTSNGNNYNQNAATYVAWNWKGDGVAGGTLNEDGTIDSQVNVNTTAGFSIATYTGQVAAGTVGHGLAQAPELVIGRPRDDADAWRVGSDFLTSWVYYLKLNDTVAETSNSAIWNSLAPTADVFNVGTDGVNGVDGRTYVAYCFHSVEGYSKIGSYVGNGDADGAFIYCGFRPSLFLVKCIDTASTNWLMYDNKRDPYNVTEQRLEPDTNDAEDTDSNDILDFVSNGIKLRGNGGGLNYGSRVQIYMAFAESPFKTANAR